MKITRLKDTRRFQQLTALGINISVAKIFVLKVCPFNTQKNVRGVKRKILDRFDWCRDCAMCGCVIGHLECVGVVGDWWVI